MRMLLTASYEKNSRSFIKPQGGQVFIKKYLEINNDIQVDIIDPQIDNLNFVKNKFRENYDYFGFYCTYPTIINTSELINEAYKYNSQAVFILGGPGVMYPDILSICYADVVIYGEGEKIISELVNLITCKKDLETKKEMIQAIRGNFMINVISNGNIYYGNSIYGCDNICEPEDLNSIIPLSDWEVDLHKKYEIWTENMLQHTYGFPIYISRGCASLGCNFCSSFEWFRSRKGVRYCSEDTAYNLIYDIFQKMPKVKEILFEDDNLLSNRKWALAFFDMIYKGLERGEIKKGCRYIIKTRVDLIDEEIIEKLICLGDVQINVGVETYSENVLYELNKTKDAKKYLNLVDTIFEYQEKYKVQFHCYMIFFTPNSSMSDLMATINLAINLLCAGIEISCYDSLLVFPGCKFDEKWKEDRETVNWVEVNNSLYNANIYSEEEIKRRNITEKVELPYNFVIKDKRVREIYEKSSKVYKWLFFYYREKFQWKVNTSYRIAIIKVLAYSIVINININDSGINKKITQQIKQLIDVISKMSSEQKENMSCEAHVKDFDRMGDRKAI